MDILDQLAKSTIKIICDNGTSGTGFFFQFSIGDESYVPTIITNRHVLENVNSVELVFSLNDYFESSQRVVEKKIIDYVDVQGQLIYHSDPNIDLCALKISPIVQYQMENNVRFQQVNLNMENVPTDQELEDLKFVEDIVMVGYPNGLSDNLNNLPIFRQGSTASHPGVDFEGRPECIVDMTITPGSSGSPVFIYNPNGYTDKKGNMNLGNSRIIFLGINKAVYTESKLGEIVEIPSPTAWVANSRIGINLGVIVKAKTIKDLERQIIKEIELLQS